MSFENNKVFYVKNIPVFAKLANYNRSLIPYGKFGTFSLNELNNRTAEELNNTTIG